MWYVLILIALFGTSLPSTSVALGSAASDSVLTKASVQRLIAEQVIRFPQEKLYLQTDRSRYMAGEQLWFRAYLVDAVLHTPSTGSSYVYVELIDASDSVVCRIRVKPHDDAFGGTLALPRTLTEGTYVLRAYTDNLRNLDDVFFFHRTVQVVSSYPGVASANRRSQGIQASQEGAHDVAFYPEGGHLLSGLPCKVAFTVKRADGSPANVNGRLVDGEGNDYGPAKTIYGGMGVLELAATPDKHYFIAYEDGSGNRHSFGLPPAEGNRYALRITASAGKLVVAVRHPPAMQPAHPLYLLLHTRGMVHYLAPFEPSTGGVSFDTSNFPAGVMQVLLLDGQANILSERLHFCPNDDIANLTFAIDKKQFGTGNKAKATLTLTDGKGLPLAGTFSVSITDDRTVAPDSSMQASSELLLGSDLDSYLPHPSYYLHRENQQALDLLMMTHRWRRYNIPEVIKRHYSYPSFPNRAGMEISGTVKMGASGKPAANQKVTLFSWQADYWRETTTDHAGRFFFDGFETPDSLVFVVQAVPREKQNNLVIDVDEEQFPPASVSAFMAKPGPIVATQTDRRPAARPGMRAILLEEAEVNANRAAINAQTFSFYMPKDDINVLSAEELEEYRPMSLSDAVKLLPFLQVMEDPETQMKKVVIDRSNYSITGGRRFAKLIVDDLILNDYDLDNVTDPTNIERIGVLKGTAAAILGGDGAGGAIVITTKRGTTGHPKKDRREHIEWLSPLGVQIPIEFEPSGQVGAVTTVYWNPNIQFPASGKAAFECDITDPNTTYTVVIEGIAANGQLIQYRQKITAR